MKLKDIEEEIKKLIAIPLSENGVNLYAIREMDDFGGPGIEILVENNHPSNKALDFEILSNLNEKISTILDEKLSLSNHYYLIVGSRGVEEKISSEKELIQAINQRMAVDLVLPDAKTMSHFEGVIKEYDPQSQLFSLEFFVKGQKRKITFLWSQIHQVRHAIKV